MRDTTRCWRLAGTGLILVLALQIAGGVAFGQPAESPLSSSYTFIVVEIPAANGQLGLTGLTDVNDQGEVLGGHTAGPDSFLLNKFEFTKIACPDVASGTGALSMNKHGAIVGFCGRHGFRRRRNGEYTFLDVPGANLTEISGINDGGDMVGDYYSAGGFHGFLRSGGQFTTIDVPFPEAQGTYRLGVNNFCQIVGFYLDSRGDEHGFFYDGTFTAIEFPDAVATLPASINDQGQIVGIYADSARAVHGFLLDDATFTTIDAPFPGVTRTELHRINNRGQIVGRMYSSSSGSRGFVATPNESPSSVPTASPKPGVKD